MKKYRKERKTPRSSKLHVQVHVGREDPTPAGFKKLGAQAESSTVYVFCQLYHEHPGLTYLHYTQP